MNQNRYFMRDLNHDKVANIMSFNVAARRDRPRAMLEISVFVAALAGYLCALAFSA
jgi:hypothetical protein